MYFSKKETSLRILYTIGIYLAAWLVKFLAVFNPKLKLGVEGRARTFEILRRSVHKDDRTIWFHCASLGEYEQGLPVFKALRNHHHTHKIILTFFSPSGYEIRKHTEVADVVVYLPMDTKANAKEFLALVAPELTVFVKYDLWPNYLLELKKHQGEAILISALFRTTQPYFKWYGGMMRETLACFDHVFVQDEASKRLLDSINYTEVTIAGDTRFDRVYSQLAQNNTLPYVEHFKNGNLCVVIGSSWPEDLEVLVPFINENPSEVVKYIIAPHAIKSEQVKDLVSRLQVPTVLYSDMEGKHLSDYQVFVLDTIGVLTKVYSYADIAYVGGAMGTTGLHNILEPAVFGVPVIIGKHYHKFPEAKRMMEHAGVRSISNHKTLKTTLRALIKDDAVRSRLGGLNREFIVNNKGAVDRILNYLNLS